MNDFLRITAGVLVAAVIGFSFSGKNKEISMVLGLSVCAMALCAVFTYVEPIIAFMEQLLEHTSVAQSHLRTILKAVGIGLVAQIASMICNDSGNSALGKTLQICSAFVILWLSLPMMQELMDLILRILGEL